MDSAHIILVAVLIFNKYNKEENLSITPIIRFV